MIKMSERSSSIRFSLRGMIFLVGVTSLLCALTISIVNTWEAARQSRFFHLLAAAGAGASLSMVAYCVFRYIAERKCGRLEILLPCNFSGTTTSRPRFVAYVAGLFLMLALFLYFISFPSQAPTIPAAIRSQHSIGFLIGLALARTSMSLWFGTCYFAELCENGIIVDELFYYPWHKVRSIHWSPERGELTISIRWWRRRLNVEPEQNGDIERLVGILKSGTLANPMIKSIS